MRLKAIQTGAFLPAECAGAVHSVFPAVCNLWLDGGRSICLMTDPAALAPHGLLLQVPAGFRFDGSVRQGQDVSLRAGVLAFQGANLEIDTRGAGRWNPAVRPWRVPPAHPRAGSAWRAARDELEVHAPWCRCLLETSLPGDAPSSGHPDACWREAVGRTLPAALSAIEGLDAAVAEDALAPWIGLGPGLTPAGDDLIAGMLLALWSLARADDGREPARAQFVEEVSARMAAHFGRTSDISRPYLEHAAAGRFSALLLSLSWAIGRGSAGDAMAAARRLTAHGATSGAAALLGALLGWRAWHPNLAGQGGTLSPPGVSRRLSALPARGEP